MFRSIMAKVASAPASKQHTILAEESCLADIASFGPSCRTIGRYALGFASPYDGHRYGHNDGSDAAGCRKVTSLVKDVGCISVEGEPPPEKRRRLINRPAKQFEPRSSELGLEAEPPSRNLRRCPDEGQHDETDEEDLAPEDPCGIHGDGESEVLPSLTSLNFPECLPRIDQERKRTKGKQPNEVVYRQAKMRQAQFVVSALQRFAGASRDAAPSPRMG